MSDKLIEALKIVETELRNMSLKDFEKTRIECNTNIPRAIDITLLFTNAIIQDRRKNNEDILSSNTHEKKVLYMKSPCLFPIETNIPIENITPFSQTDTEDLPNTELVSKTPYRDITTYREEWHFNPKDN